MFDGVQSGERGPLVGEPEQLDRGAFRKERDRREVAPEHAEEIEFAVRQVVIPSRSRSKEAAPSQ